MLIRIQYFGVDREPDTSITVYCDNISALCQLETSVQKRSARHCLIPEYYLVNKLQQCIKKLCLNVDPEHVKGHQDDGSHVDCLHFTSRMNIACNELAGNYLSSFGIPDPTYWNSCDSAPFLLSSSTALIIDNQIIPTSIKQQFCLTINGASLCTHIIKRKK